MWNCDVYWGKKNNSERKKTHTHTEKSKLFEQNKCYSICCSGLTRVWNEVSWRIIFRIKIEMWLLLLLFLSYYSGGIIKRFLIFTEARKNTWNFWYTQRKMSNTKNVNKSSYSWHSSTKNQTEKRSNIYINRK